MRNANPDWWQHMLEIGREVCAQRQIFTTDDLMRLHRARQGPETHEPRAMGPLMHALQALGYCEPTQDWVESTQRINHRRPQRVWYSLIYRGNRRIRRRPQRKLLDPRQFDMLAEE